VPNSGATPPIPSVTVVIPCFNYGAFVRKAVDSALAQQGADVRIVVVDDGSTDRHSARQCDACAGPRVSVIHQPNSGLPAARNRGARGAASDYLLFLDADDWLEPSFVAECHAAISADQSAGRGDDVSHAYTQQRRSGLGDGVWEVPDWDPLLLMVTNLHGPTALVRRDKFEDSGGFNEAMREGYEDWDFWITMAERGWRGVRVRRPLYVWHRHSPRTMIARAGERHAAIYRRMVENHRALYERHAAELTVRMNSFLRRHDLNWIDQTGLPRELRYLRGVRDGYEAMAAVRLHHALHRWVRALPGPLSRGATRALSFVKQRLASR